MCLAAHMLLIAAEVPTPIISTVRASLGEFLSSGLVEDVRIGIVGGRDKNGELLIIHDSSGYNNMTITNIAGFTSIGMPIYYRDI